VGQSNRWSSIISRDKTDGGGTDVQDRDRLELDYVVKTKSLRSRMMARVLLWSIYCAVALRRFWLATEFGCEIVYTPCVGKRTPALSEN